MIVLLDTLTQFTCWVTMKTLCIYPEAAASVPHCWSSAMKGQLTETLLGTGHRSHDHIEETPAASFDSYIPWLVLSEINK